MTPLEIVVLLAAVLIVAGVVGSTIYKRIKHIPTGDCASCAKAKKGQSLVDEYHKKYCCKNRK